MPLPVEFNFENGETCRCRGKASSDKVDCKGEYFGFVYIKDTKWAIVLWDGDYDPDLYKANLIEIEVKQWRSIS